MGGVGGFVKQAIVGFDQDEIGDFRAILACGHRQHVRHNPPLVDRPWVLTEEGRSRFLGVTLDCKACDEGEPVGDGILSAGALEALYTQFDEALQRIVRRRVTRPDAGGETLLAVYQTLHDRAGGLRDSDSLTAWLYDIVRDATGDAHGPTHPSPGPAERPPLPEADDPAAVELAAALKALLACLPGEYRQALLLAEYQGLKLDEIAYRLDISPEEAEGRVQRARAMLSEALLDLCAFVWERHGGSS